MTVSRVHALCVATLLLFATSRNAESQTLREIGRTAAGNPVFLEPTSVRRTGDSVTATVRVRFARAVRAPGGEWWSSRTRLTLACTPKQVRVAENWYYADTTWRRIAQHQAVGRPAFGTVIGGSMVAVAHTALCTVR
jgi:hypothetical protein